MLINNNYKPHLLDYKRPEIIPMGSNWRVIFILIFLLLLFAAIIFCAVNFYTSKSLFWINKANNVSIRVINTPAERGKIMDRNGIVLAIDKPVRTIILDTHKIPNFDQKRIKAGTNSKLLNKINLEETTLLEKIDKLSGLLRIDKDKLYQYFNTKTYLTKSRGDIYLSRRLDKRIADQIEELKIPGIKIVHASKRMYPDGRLFSHVVGVSKIDLDSSSGVEKLVGLEGMEFMYNKDLESHNGSQTMIHNNLGDYIGAIDSSNNKPAINGKDIQLSLDKSIQLIVYDALSESVKKHNAKSGSAVVLDAKTGEVLAMVNYPDFDPDRFTKYDSQVRRNKAVVDLFEPGSTIKPFIVAKALEEKIVGPNTVINTMPYNIGDKTIRDVHDYPSLSVGGILQKSSNVGVSKLALSMTSKNVFDILTSSGFGSKPSFQFPGEAKGVIRDWSNWQKLDKAVISYGYGIQVSLLQLARAYTIFTNNGNLLPVSFIKKNGNNIQGNRVISNDTAKLVKEMLFSVVEKGGTGTRAQINGYKIAGKSGTARKIINQRYANDSHIAFFIGFAPLDNPDVIVAVSIDSPKEGGYYGGLVAAPIFSDIMGKILNIRGIVPDQKQ